MDFQTEAKTYADPEKMAKAYLSKYYGNAKIEYPINPFEMLKNEGVLFSISNFHKLEGLYIPAFTSVSRGKWKNIEGIYEHSIG